MGEDSGITQRTFLTSARLALSRLHLDGDLSRPYLQAAQISSSALNVARVGVWFFDLGHGQLRCEALFDGRGTPPPPPLQLPRLPEYVRAIREKRFLATTDARTAPETRELGEYLVTWGVGAMLDAAIYRNGEVIGVVCHEHVGPPREWKREEQQFAATVADLVSHFIEVNDRLAAEAQAHALALKLKDAHRLDALGHLAAGVAHDLNNLLGVITNGIAVLQRTGDLSVLSSMDESARHAAALLSQLMQLGRNKQPVATVLSLDQVLADFEKLAASQVQPPWRIVSDVQKGLEVWAEAAQLQQVLLNLVVNACQAMPKGGVVVLRAHPRQDGVALEVIDTGEGIAPENLERLFDPFFTTRKSGNGIGLAVVQQVVRQHGGELKVSSALGDGTTFRIWWPSHAPVES